MPALSSCPPNFTRGDVPPIFHVDGRHPFTPPHKPPLGVPWTIFNQSLSIKHIKRTHFVVLHLLLLKSKLVENVIWKCDNVFWFLWTHFNVKKTSMLKKNFNSNKLITISKQIINFKMELNAFKPFFNRSLTDER